MTSLESLGVFAAMIFIAALTVATASRLRPNRDRDRAKELRIRVHIVEADLMFDHQYLLPLGPTSPRCDESRTHRAPAAGLPCPLRRLMFHVISDWALLVVICVAIAAALVWLWRF